MARGHGLTFTIGPARALRGRGASSCAARGWRHGRGARRRPGGLWRRLVTDSQLRWLGPGEGRHPSRHGPVVNVVWDLPAKRRGKPLWKLLADLSPEEIVDCIDFRYIADVLTDEALDLLRDERSEARRAGAAIVA